MRFLDDYLDTLQPSSPTSAHSPAALRTTAPEGAIARPDRATLEAHLARRHYGPFTLTDAIRPGWQLDVVPRAGYRHDAYVDPRTGTRLPALVAAISSEHLFETFLQLTSNKFRPCDFAHAAASTNIKTAPFASLSLTKSPPLYP